MQHRGALPPSLCIIGALLPPLRQHCGLPRNNGVIRCGRHRRVAVLRQRLDLATQACKTGITLQLITGICEVSPVSAQW